ncbi:MAG: di-heme oxidoredictase family protein [Pseudomonadota bacterium]
MLFALSSPMGGPDPVFGHQFQDQAIAGFLSEGRVTVSYETQTFTYPDGQTVDLRKPIYTTDAALTDGISLNPRVAPQMIGLGLIEAIAEADLAAHADPDDTDGDGISGRLSRVDAGVGRFGWKAMEPTLVAQTATAFSNDMGLSTRLRTMPWGDCTADQAECRTAVHGNEAGTFEIADDLLDLAAFYSAHLAVPARRDIDDPEVLRGKALFYAAQCVSCHVPKFATAADAAEPLRNQLIWPYSDFLLHDMGPGLADANPTGDVAGAEWRTPPLWGIGLTETVSGHTYFLHDGRARSLEEAVLWHGGEAEAARDAFAAATAEDRAALIAFLESL